MTGGISFEEIDTELREDPICPHCGCALLKVTEDEDLAELFKASPKACCEWCKAKFRVEVHTQTLYTTHLLERGK